MVKVKRVQVGEKSQKFSFSPYNCAQERDFLLFYELNSSNLTLETLNDFFDMCIAKGLIVKYDDTFIVSIELKLALLYYLRAISVGEEITVSKKCSTCVGKTNKFKVSVDFLDDFKGHEIILSRKNSQYKFTASLTINDFKKYFEISKIEFMNNVIFDRLDKSTNINSADEYSEIYNSLDVDEADFIQNELDILNNTHKNMFVQKKICATCKTEQEINLFDLDVFFNSLSEDSLVSFYKSVTSMVYFGKFSKVDIDSMYPFERNIYANLLKSTIEEYNKTKTN